MTARIITPNVSSASLAARPSLNPSVLTSGDVLFWLDAGDKRCLGDPYRGHVMPPRVDNEVIEGLSRKVWAPVGVGSYAEASAPSDERVNSIGFGGTATGQVIWRYRSRSETKKAALNSDHFEGCIENDLALHAAFGNALGAAAPSSGQYANRSAAQVPLPALGMTWYALIESNGESRPIGSGQYSMLCYLMNNGAVRAFCLDSPGYGDATAQNRMVCNVLGASVAGREVTASLPGGGWINSAGTPLLIRINCNGLQAAAGGVASFRADWGAGSHYVGGAVNDTFIRPQDMNTDGVSNYGFSWTRGDNATSPLCRIYELIGIQHKQAAVGAEFNRADDLAVRSYLNARWGLGITVAADTNLPA